MPTSIRLRLFLTCFLLIAIIVLAVDATHSLGTTFFAIFELFLCGIGAAAVTSIFSRALAWRIQRLRTFTDTLLDSPQTELPLPGEDDATRALNQSLRRMAGRIHELVERLSHESNRLDAILNSMRGGRARGGSPDARAVRQQALETALGLKAPVARDTPLVGRGAGPGVPEPDFRSGGDG